MSVIQTLIIFLITGVVYVILEALFLFEGTDLITKGLAFGLSLFLVYMSITFSKDAYKQVGRTTR